MKQSREDSIISLINNDQWKCVHHHSSYCHFLHLSMNSQVHIICQDCIVENQIHDQEILSIVELLESNEITFLSNYPVLEDHKVLEDLKILHSQFDGVISQMKHVNISLASKINNQYQNLLKFFQLVIKSLEGIMLESKELYIKIAQINKLKTAILSVTPNFQDELHVIIMDHISKSKTNSYLIQKVVSRFQKIIRKFFEQKDKISIQISQQLKNLVENQPKSKAIISKIGIKICKSKIKDLETLFLKLSGYKGLIFLELQNEQDIMNLFSNLDGEVVSILSSTLCKLKNLNSLKLNLSHNKIKQEGFLSLSFALSQLKYLNYLELNLWNNIMKQQEEESLFLALRQLTNLKSLNLNLRNNSIDQKGAELLSLALIQIKNLSSLQLDLWGNDIKDKGAESLFSAFIELKNLYFLQLNFQWNQISDNGAKSISSALIHLTNLNFLELKLISYNISLKGEGVKSLLSSLNHLKSMKLKKFFIDICK